MAIGSGYHAIALPLPHSAFNRFCYVKKHEEKKADSEDHSESILVAGRTAYIVNLPSEVDDEWLRDAIQNEVGNVQHIIMHSSDNDVHSGDADAMDATITAHIVFKSKTSLAKLVALEKLDSVLPTKTKGLEHYLDEYRQSRPGLSAVKELADQFMGAFDADEEEDQRRREELQNKVDDDGFMTVVNTKKRTQDAPEVVQPAKKQKKKELENFYRFQMREKKRDQLKSLRERFEEDRQLVDKLKKANKFKPE